MAERTNTGVQVLVGRYEIRSLLGTGGMGAVYRAYDRELDEVVALKMLRKELSGSAEIVARFRNEAKLARKVTHPNVARTFDIGEHEGDKFLTMELIDGESLGAKVARVGAFPLVEVIDLTEAICAGLTAAHAAGVVHRDLKPDNVILAKDGGIKITDFGIARALVSDDGAPGLTLGTPIGTPAYMAPEQVEGSSDIDARADVYALGAMLFELMTGQLPWNGDSIFTIASARLLAPPPDPRALRRDLPDALARIVQRCMARNRDDRYSTASEVAQSLSGITLPSDALLRAATPSIQVRPRSSSSMMIVEETAVSRLKSIAVLPFQNLGAPQEQHFVDGITDDLIDTLSMMPGLRTRPRSAVTNLKRTSSSSSDGHAPRDARDLGRELGVHVVVEGSFAKIDDRIQTRIRLISVEDGFQLWAKRFDLPVGKLFDVGEEAARAIANALTVNVDHRSAAASSTALLEPPPAMSLNPQALDLYLRARQQFRSDQGSAKDTAKLFEQALALAPDNAMILSGYAQALGRLVSFGLTDNEGAKRAAAMAERAVAAAPHLPEARVALARLRYVEGDYNMALVHVRGAVAVAPNYADGHAFWGRLLIEVGDLEAGILRCRAALSLDEGLIFARSDLARAYWSKRDWAAATNLLAAGKVPPGNEAVVAVMRARAILWRGDKSDPVGLSEAESVLSAIESVPQVVRLCVLVIAQAVTGRPVTREDRATFEALMTVGPAAHFLGLQMKCELSVVLGEDEAALTAIEQANETLHMMDVAWLDHCPLFDRFRSNPRFTIARAGFASRASALKQMPA